MRGGRGRRSPRGEASEAKAASRVAVPVRARERAREARSRRRPARGRRRARREHRLQLADAAHHGFDAHAASAPPRRCTASASSSSVFWERRAHSASCSACWRSLSLSIAWRSRAAAASTVAAGGDLGVAAGELERRPRRGGARCARGRPGRRGGRRGRRGRCRRCRGRRRGRRRRRPWPRRSSASPSARTRSSLRQCLARLLFSALADGPDPLEPEREGRRLHVLSSANGVQT